MLSLKKKIDHAQIHLYNYWQSRGDGGGKGGGEGKNLYILQSVGKLAYFDKIGYNYSHLLSAVLSVFLIFMRHEHTNK